MRYPLVLVALFFASVLSVAQQVPTTKEDEPQFPSNEEIKLVTEQSERAFKSYKQSLLLEKKLKANTADPSGLAKDNELAKAADTLIAALKKDPSAFHGAGGLLLLSTLDDASRNAALCASTGMAEAGSITNTKDTAKGYETLVTVQACISVSEQLYSVSESVQALFLREIEAQQALADKAVDALQQCAAAMGKTSK